MLISSFRKISIISLFGLAFALSISSITFLQNNQPKLSLKVAGQPDALMEKIISINLDTEGQPALKIISDQMTHFPGKDITQIEQPRVLVYRHSPEPWQIDSLHAEASHNMNTIEFSKHVVVKHAADANTTQTTILTEKLTVFPNKQKAETNLPVTINQPNAIMQGVGMQSDLKTGTIHLLSQTKGQYIPDA